MRKWKRYARAVEEDCEAMFTRAREAEARNRALEAVENYADHQSWRCGYPDRYPHEPDCPCGLIGTLKQLGLAQGEEE